ncbi:hypothetical protein BGX28_005170 [Mortierella sp. GBA30]|nr:hypothetical protein BGX28_005170 [Mortierella sp. GBA30]
MPTAHASHDPTFSPPLKRKKDPLPPSDRNTKSQRMTDHLTARLATSLYVSPSVTNIDNISQRHAGLENLRGFYRVREQVENDPGSSQDSNAGNTPFAATSSEPRKYRKATGNRSNPTTPVSSHPSSPGAFPHSAGDDIFSLTPPSNSTPGKTLFESFAKNANSQNFFLDPTKSARSSNLHMRRESRPSQHHARTPLYHPLAVATRLALFHRILSTTKSTDAQTLDKEVWITNQFVKRGFPDRASFEAAMTSHNQALVAALISLGGRLLLPMQRVSSSQSIYNHQQNQEILLYNMVQATVDAILDNAHWLCGPDFEMGINRICPQWSVHEGSVEHIVHYVQVVESMRETLSGRFQHPEDLSDDLTRSQEAIDYQRTLFGETLRNHGLEWKALGLPPMEGLIHETKEWILNLAKTLTVKIRAEMTLALERTHYNHQASGTNSPLGMDVMDEAPGIDDRPIEEVMDMAVQGALLTASCLELAGKPCPMLVTAWMELASQYCVYALGKRKQHVLKAIRASSTSYSRKKPMSIGITVTTMQQQLYQHTPSGMSRGVFLKTMELFENVSRLLQCVQEMQEEEEVGYDDDRRYFNNGLGISDTVHEMHQYTTEDERPGASAPHGTSAASSDQDEPMDFMDFMSTATVSSSTDSLARHYGTDHEQRQQLDHGSGQQYPILASAQDRRLAHPSAGYQKRMLPVDSSWLQRWIATESLASILVETGLELCESMAETLGGGQTTATTTAPSTSPLPSTPLSSAFNPSLTLPASLTLGTYSGLVGNGTHSSPFVLQASSPHFTSMTPSARAQAAITSLTAFSGGGAMASGTGGVGLIYVQFVVRMLSKIIEFAGLDSHQEMRLSDNMSTAAAKPAAEPVDTALIPTLEDQILQLADHEAWLDAQIRELEFANENDTTAIPEESRSTLERRQELEQRIDFLKQELATAVALETVRNTVVDSVTEIVSLDYRVDYQLDYQVLSQSLNLLHSAHAYQVVLKSLFKSDHDQDENAIEERDEAVSEYLHIHRELKQARQDLSAVQVQVLDCQDDNRKLAQSLAQETEAMKEAMALQDSKSSRRMAQRMEEELKSIIIKHSVVSNVLQGLLLESGIDWANDSHYLDVMLKLRRTTE